MSTINNFNVLPFYTSLSKQNSKKWYSFGNVYPLASPKDKILPFQIVMASIVSTVSSITIHNQKTGATTSSGLTPTIFTPDGSNYSIVYLKLSSISSLQEGRYYLSFSIDGITMYSEIFNAISDLSEYVKLEYWNEDDLYNRDKIQVYFGDDFRFTMYICTDIGKPEYIFEEELTKRLGYKFLESQISNKLYKFTFLAPEYMTDSMRIIRLCDFIKLTQNDEEYNALNFAYDAKWEQQGDLASVECEFETDTIIQKLQSFNRRQQQSFYNALLSNIDEPILFDTEVVAQYYADFQTGGLIQGKLIHELELETELKPEAFIPIDNNDGTPAKKISVTALTSSSHSHANKTILDLITQGHLDILSHFSVEEGRVKVNTDFWSTGEVSAYGAGAGTGGGAIGSLGGLANVGLWADEVPASDRIMVQLAGATHWSSKLLSEIVGLDTNALASYLTTNNYATKNYVTEEISKLNIHTHENKTLLDLITQGNIDVLSHLSIVDGRLKADVDFYSTGEVSAYGAGSGSGSGGGLISSVLGSTGLGGSYLDSDLTNTFNAYTINLINNNLTSALGRIGALETNTPNVSWGTPTAQYSPLTINSVTRNLSVDGHTHSYLPLSGGNLTGDLTILTNKVWHAGNDGADSGLDADLLRGVAPSNLAVLSATKLANTRTIWGQSFNGEGDITGDLKIGYNSGFGISYSYEDRTLYNYFYGGSVLNLKVGEWTYSNVNVFNIETHNGGTAKRALSVMNNGFVGINTNNPLYDLDVNGVFRSVGAAYLNSTLSVTGASTFTGLLTANGGINATAGAFSSYVAASRVIAGYDAGIAGSVSCSNWFRSNGETGWYNETFGAGIKSDTANVVRTYSTNKFKVYNTEADSITTLGGIKLWNGIKSVTLTVDENDNLKIDGNVYATGEVSAYGAGTGTGSGPGIIQSVLGSAGLGGGYSDTDLTNTFNAYTINLISNNLTSAIGRIGALETNTPNVSWGTPTAQYSPLTINSVTRNLSVDGHTHSSFLDLELKNIQGGDINHRLELGYSGRDYVNWYEYGGLWKFIQRKNGFDTELFQINTTNILYRGNAVWHAGNFNPSNYLPLTGGTLSRYLEVDTPASSGSSFIMFLRNGVPVGYVGDGASGANTSISFYNSVSGKGISLGNDGKLRYDGVFVWHAGNDGAGSGLDADLLDGFHNREITARSLVRMNFSNIDDAMSTNTDYGIYQWSGWSNPITNGISGGYNVGLSVCGVDSTKYGFQLGVTSFASSDRLYYKGWSDGTNSGWKGLAFLTDNVASATKLANTRTIWGQSFNGEGDITGNLKIGYANAFGISYSPSDTNLYNYFYGGSVLNLKVGEWTYSNVNVFNIETHNGGTAKRALSVMNNGFVGINTNNPLYDLDVNGVFRTTGEITSNNHLTTTEATNAAGHFGNIACTWGNNGGYPTLFSNAADRWIMHINPHISYVQNGVGGYTGVMNGARVRFAGDTAVNSWWDLGVGVNNVGSDKFSVCRFTSSFVSIDNTGNVGIGTTSPSYKLDVNGVVRATRIFSGYDSGVAGSVSCSNWFRSSGTSGWYNESYGGGVYMEDSTYVRVYNSKSFWVNGNIVATGEVTAYAASDGRLKENIRPITSALDVIEKLNPVSYKWNSLAKELNPLKNDNTDYGLIAQELESVMPELVHTVYGQYKSVDYIKIIPHLICAIKQLKMEIDMLKS